MKAFVILLTFLFISNSPGLSDLEKITDDKMQALIIDGQNNHGIWPKTTMMMKEYLEQTGLFEVNIARLAHTWQGPHYDPSIGLKDITELLEQYPLKDKKQTYVVEEPQIDLDFSPDFAKYDVVINNLGWQAAPWPEKTKSNFEKYMIEGGGLVIVHAANNSWGDWEEYNKMIGLGGWGGRSEESGPYVYYDDSGKLVRDSGDGECGSHGPQQEFMITTRDADHPIMKDLPTRWLHAKDELYDRLRGPAENMKVLATAYSDIEKNGPPWNKSVNGTGRHEPMLMTIQYGSGRVFHTALGHMDYSMECVGFITTFQRGAEWVATGNVTQKIPEDFPSFQSLKARKWAGM